VTPEFAKLPQIAPEMITVPSRSGMPIYSRLYRDPSNATSGLRPAVMFVHGAGYLQNAHEGWSSSYFHEHLFHQLLIRRGYVVLDLDYRGSAGYGRAWRTAIYRQMGTPELEDYLDGIDWLAKNASVDRTRIGIYGGSYGGFLTLMALFKTPDTFAAGAALRPVTDWTHYNHEYTAGILNVPDLDPEAYARSSPIEFAAGLKHPLLICHGMMDDNVFFQDSVRLVQRLIELKKDSFETAIFPVERHGFTEPTSWLNEYSRILRLFEREVAHAAPAAR
jgi:dipeptidyl aminopeptidase/acylaminoacyl peptidase